MEFKSIIGPQEAMQSYCSQQCRVLEGDGHLQRPFASTPRINTTHFHPNSYPAQVTISALSFNKSSNWTNQESCVWCSGHFTLEE